MKMCSICKEYSKLDEVRILGVDKIVYVCEECDLLWEQYEDIGLEGKGSSFSKYLMNLGLEGTWEEVEILRENVE